MIVFNNNDNKMLRFHSIVHEHSFINFSKCYGNLPKQDRDTDINATSHIVYCLVGGNNSLPDLVFTDWL